MLCKLQRHNINFYSTGSYIEMRDYSVFNKYSRGEPSMRLYVKNLGKNVEEKVCNSIMCLIQLMNAVMFV